MLIFVNLVKEEKVDNSKYRSIKKSRNQIIKILDKSKSRNFIKFNFENLFKFKKSQNAKLIKKPNFSILDTRIVIIKLRQAFI